MKKILLSLGGGLAVFAFSLMFAMPAMAAENWSLSGTYDISFTCTSGCSGVYPHELTTSDYDLGTGSFTATGVGTKDGKTWTSNNGQISNNSISFKIIYNNPTTYFVNVTGTINSNGIMTGEAVSSSAQEFNWITSPAATFNRHAEITKPTVNQQVSGTVQFEANLMDDDQDGLQWAIRKGTCAANKGTVFGNVDGKNDSFTWNYANKRHDFFFEANMAENESGMYCFVFNPIEDNGELDIRKTVEFNLLNATPINKDECKNGGWGTFSLPEFKNQGDCVSWLQSNSNAKGNKKNN